MCTGSSTSRAATFVAHPWRARPRVLGLGAFGLLFFISPPAHAYLDPGTGSALVYVVIGIVLSVYFLAIKLFNISVEFILRSRVRLDNTDLVLHSEDPRYEITFLPVINALASRGLSMTFFTMYPRGRSFEALPDVVKHHEIPPGLLGYSFLNHLRATVLVTTTPQVDVMMFRRSKHVKHYCHIPHALGESRFVRPYAYDYFDSVLCCGPLLYDNIRRIEALRGLPTKRLFRTGVPHYDRLLAKVRARGTNSTRRTVLVAPSWGPMSLFQVFGVDFLGPIAKRYDLIVRPHPQMKISQPDVYQRVLANPFGRVDTSSSPVEAISAADTVLSDISGIAYEFAFLHGKPVLVVDHKLGVAGLEGHFLPDEPTLQQVCQDFIIGIPASDIVRVADRIDEVLSKDLSSTIQHARDQYVFNFGEAAPVAAAQIEEVLRCP